MRSSSRSFLQRPSAYWSIAKKGLWVLLASSAVLIVVLYLSPLHPMLAKLSGLQPTECMVLDTHLSREPCCTETYGTRTG